MDTPHLKLNGGFSNYKNVKSGNYNRQPCWTCHDFKGFPQTPGLFDLNIVNAPQISEKKLHFHKVFQPHRLSNHPGSYNSGYVNYLNEDSSYLYPKRYIKGFWPDEQLVYTNTPK